MAALMWQMSMQNPMAPPMPMPGMPMWPPPPAVSPWLNVRVDGLKFDYQLTEDDVRKVFARYGTVVSVKMDREGTNSQVQFAQPHEAMAAQHDLDRKQLAGMQGAFLTVEFAAGGYGGVPPPFDPNLVQMASQNPFMNPMMGAYPMAPPPSAMPSSPGGGQPKKYTCKLEVGIENEGEFRVGSKVIQIARNIWQDQNFQSHAGKTRLRGKGIGGPHEADEPLALCISCKDQVAFDKAVTYAETQLQKVHDEFKVFCVQQGKPVPELSMKITKKGTTAGPDTPASSSGKNMSRGERPAGAPSDEEIEALIEERNEARKASNFKKADEVRDMLKARGVVLMDEKGAKGTFKGNEVTKWRFWRP
eukprot:TRINITY_DN5104_c0_g1_i1.p1 TRINITY_DN5104_c0_g1~~TRINITY_DN5104_c0_g1_i1.p1  ORF type:complete len:398 (-),score=99.14 TRINITY_DN5104_c0_g1_i1:39-1121(-)